jgi:hypothetical protein
MDVFKILFLIDWLIGVDANFNSISAILWRENAILNHHFKYFYVFIHRVSSGKA